MRIIRLTRLTEMTGLSRSTIWRLERAGTFPHRRQLSPGTVGWIESEVVEWLQARAAPRGYQ